MLDGSQKHMKNIANLLRVIKTRVKKWRSTYTDPAIKLEVRGSYTIPLLEAGVEILIFIIKYWRIIRALFHQG